jgi:hypothetical protein
MDGAVLAAWAAMWAPGDMSPKAAADQAWRLRWQEEHDRAKNQRPRRSEQAADDPLFTKDTLRKHKGLYKAESSVLIQARTGKIGLRDFLFKQHVPEVASPLCSCSRTERETIEHLVLRCENVSRQQRAWLQEHAQPLRTGRDFVAALQESQADREMDSRYWSPEGVQASGRGDKGRG